MSQAPEGTGERFNPRSLLRWLPGLLFTLVAVLFLAFSINWSDFVATLSSIPAKILLLVVVIYLTSMLARAVCWWNLLQRKVSLGRAILGLNEGYFLNNILPLRLGELGRSVLIGKHSALGTFYVFSTVVVERSYDMAIAAGLLLATLPLALQMSWARPVAVALLALIVGGLAALYFAARFRVPLEARLLRWSERRLFLKRWVIPPLRSLLDGFSVLNRPQFFILSFLSLALSWTLALVNSWVIIATLHPGAPFWWAMLAISASNLGGALPSNFASLGVFEAAAVAALALVGMPTEAALAYALIVHVTHLIFSSSIGGYALSQEGKSLAGIYADLRSARGA